MKFYLSGPMTGYPDWNYPAFAAAAELLRYMGHQVLSPAENFAGATNKTYAEYMRLDIEQVLSVEAIAVLPHWWTSRGACIEVSVARVIGLPILDAATLLPADDPPFAEIEHILGQVLKWGRETFQPNGEDRIAAATAHLVEEAEELKAAPRDMGEVADCFMLLAHIVGMNGRNATSAIKEKLAECRTRKWNIPDGEGIIRHVREDEVAA